MTGGFSSLRILPLLVLVAFLSFSVRLAEVAIDVSTLSGAAQAEDKQDAGTDIMEVAQAEGVAPSEEGLASAAEQEGTLIIDDDVSEDSDPALMFLGDGDDSEWRAAGDVDMEYKAARMELFKDLAERRKDLEARERSLVTREALLKAAEQELDRKYQELSQLRSRIENLLDQQSEEEKARVESLVKIYEGMKPKDAARIFDTLDLDVLISVVADMSERKLSPILANMNPERARTVTIMMAEQKKLPTLPLQN